jgi:tetratricopeptide (TPR) repeat protein
MHMKLALLYEKRNNYDQAVNHYQAILSLDPNAAIPLNQLAWLYADRNSHLDEALKYGRKAAELDPGNGNILDTLGWVYFKRGNYGEALRHFEEAVRLNKSHPSIYYHLALAYDKNNKREKAKKALKTALDISDQFPEAKEAKELLEKWL